jgi:hypothetical protein
MVIIAPATVWYLVSSFKGLTAGSKHAYYMIALGIILFAVTQISQVLALLLFTIYPSLLDVISSNATTATYVTLSVLSTLAFYMGVRKLTKLLSIKTVWLSVATVLAFGIAFAGLSLLLPRTPLDIASEETTATIVFATMAFACGINVATALGAHSIRKNIGSGYRNAMQWLGIGLWIMAATVAQEIIFKGTDLVNTAYVNYTLDLTPFLLTALALMKAGHALMTATFKRPESKATYIDSVIYAAGLVSNPRTIDPILDRMRNITARLDSPSATLNPADKQELITVYRQIEDYLETKEPIRNISRTSLRERLPNEFQALVQ